MFDLYDKWVEEQENAAAEEYERKGFVGQRSYRHFDKPISLDVCTKLRSKFCDVEELRRHKFWPFIEFEQSSRRYRKDVNRNLSISKKIRPIMYAPHQDACLMSFYASILKCNYESRIQGTLLADSVIGYRKIPLRGSRNKSNIDFAKDVHEYIKGANDSVVLCIDIKNFFGEMSHDLIWQAVREFTDESLHDNFLPIIKAVTKYRYIAKDDVSRLLGDNSNWASPRLYNSRVRDSGFIHRNRHTKGIPQGSPISDIIANIYMYNFDKLICQKISNYSSGLYRRYSDDIIVIIPSDRLEEIYDIIQVELSKIKLTINGKKTEVFYVNRADDTFQDKTGILVDGYAQNKKMLQYLGFEMDLQRIHARAGTVAKLYRKEKRKKRHDNSGRPHREETKDVSHAGVTSDANKTKKLGKSSKYGYYKQATKKLGNHMGGQFRRIRRRVKRIHT